MKVWLLILFLVARTATAQQEVAVRQDTLAHFVADMISNNITTLTQTVTLNVTNTVTVNSTNTVLQTNIVTVNLTNTTLLTNAVTVYSTNATTTLATNFYSVTNITYTTNLTLTTNIFNVTNTVLQTNVINGGVATSGWPTQWPLSAITNAGTAAGTATSAYDASGTATTAAQQATNGITYTLLKGWLGFTPATNNPNAWTGTITNLYTSSLSNHIQVSSGVITNKL
jgi:hypothetical protein